MPEKRRIPKVFIVVGGLVLLFLAIAGVAFSLTDIPRAVSKLQENEERARSAGLFLTSQAYKDSLRVEDSDNGASLMAEVIADFEQGVSKIKLYDEKRTVKNPEAILKTYADFAQNWQKIDQAASRKKVIFPRNRKSLIELNFKEFSSLKGIVKLAQARADLAIDRDEPAIAAEAWRRGAQISLMADDEPILIGMLVRIACAAIVERSIQTALTKHGQSPTWRAAAWQTLQILDKPIDFRAAMRSEHSFALEAFDTLTKPGAQLFTAENSDPTEMRYLKIFTKLPRAREATESRIHEGYAGFMEQLGDDPFDTTPYQKAAAWLDGFQDREGLSYTIVRIMLPVFSQAGKAIAKEYAQRNVLMQAVKLLENPNLKELPLKGRYMLDNDGKNLRMAFSKNGLIVYSIGPDYVDDGGQLNRSTSNSGGSVLKNFDYGVLIPR